MSASGPVRPPTDAWVAAVHASEADFEPLGSAVVIAEDQVLTCAHVVMPEGVTLAGLWVAFPKADGRLRRRVAAVRTAYARPVLDLAVLVLEEPVPPAVRPAPVRCPAGDALVDHAWWAFGFPDQDPVGDSADGQVGAALSYGWVRLDTTSRYLIRPGFSGGGLWAPDYQAVVGIVGHAHANGDGRALTLHQADLTFPDLKLAALAAWSAEAAGEVALSQWGWTLALDPEGERHWRPRARGVSIESERGWRFRGRTAALRAIVAWLDRVTADRRVLVVTGSPGVGKSAVLGRIVTTADAGLRGSLPPGDEAVRASAGSVSCAVHAKGKTALEVAEEIARAASAALPGEPQALGPAIRDVLSQRGGTRFNVIIDALDEADSPAQARAIIERIALPLAETCADVGAQVIVGSRRRDDGGDLLARFGRALKVIDLDDPGYFAEEDLAAYALACLQLAGAERPGNPYADDALAEPLAARIAARSGQNFLIAGLVARSHGLHDDRAADAAGLEFTATVDSALAGYLQRLAPVSGLRAADVLTALAFAEAPGFPASLWQLAAETLYGTSVSRDDLARFARSSAANFLVESDGEQAGPAYRLFHQALNDTLRRARADIIGEADDQRALSQAFIGRGRLSGWREAPGYLLRSLAGHAQAAGLIDDLLTDDAYLLHADLRRLVQAGEQAVTADGRRRARLLQLTPQAAAAPPGERAALFSVAEALDDLGTSYRSPAWAAPYRARWATARPRSERTVLESGQGEVYGVCAIGMHGQDLLASAGADGTVRIWDPATGVQRAVLEGHEGGVNAVCAVSVRGEDLLASAGSDATVRIWDPAAGVQRAVLEGHEEASVYAVCAVSAPGQALVASSGEYGKVRIWDPATGVQRAVLEGYEGSVNAVCAVSVRGEDLLASGGNDGTVRIWDPATGAQRGVLRARQGEASGSMDQVYGLCAVDVNGRRMLAAGDYQGTIRIWDPATAEQRAVLDGHVDWVNAVCAVSLNGRDLLASGGTDGTVRIWDPATGEERAALESHPGDVYGVCAITVNGRRMLASGGDDGTVRIWDPVTSAEVADRENRVDWVQALCAMSVGSRDLLASGDGKTVRIWDPASGEQRAVLEGHLEGVSALCAVTVAGQRLLASGDHQGTVRIWDPGTGEQRAVLDCQGGAFGMCAVALSGRDQLAIATNRGTVLICDPQTGIQHGVLEGHRGRVGGVCAVRVRGRDLLASAGYDGTIKVWDPATGEQCAAMENARTLNGLCVARVRDRDLLASAGYDGAVRIWDPATGEQRAALDGHRDSVEGVCAVSLDGRALVASVSQDRTVRIWDPDAGLCVLTVPVYHPARAVAWAADALVVGLDAGILAIELGGG